MLEGAAGGVGTAVLQIAAAAFGVRVIALASTDEKEALARSLGADEVVRSPSRGFSVFVSSPRATGCRWWSNRQRRLLH